MCFSTPTASDSVATKSHHLPYLIVRLKQQQLAISSECVKQILLMPEVITLPDSPSGVRGAINIRGSVMPLVDLRVLMGMSSFVQDTQETIQILHEREQDHKNWIAALQTSVDERKPFTLARNPHMCKFGKWYDTYKPESQSVAFLALWRSLDQPHGRIHAIADRVCQLTDQGKYDEARAIISATREVELKEMIHLLDEMRRVLHQTSREVAVVLSQKEARFAVSVDEVIGIETLAPQSIEPLPELTSYESTKLTPEVARRRNSKQLVLLLNHDELFKGIHQPNRDQEFAEAVGQH